MIEAQRELTAHEWPQGASVRVRMGLHTGEPIRVRSEYVGMDVHRAARIANVGHGGQVLLSETTAALIIDELPEGIAFLDLGRHLLKDMRRPERIRQLVIEGLPSEFPPLKSLETLPPEISLDVGEIELPAFLEGEVDLAPVPVFVGRERELARLSGYLEAALAGEAMIAFVSGVAGSGKTSLVREIARLAQEYHPGLVAALGSCSAFSGIGDPFQPFRDIFAMLCGDVEAMWETGSISRDHAVRLWKAIPEMVMALLTKGIDLIDVLIPRNLLLTNAKAAGGSHEWVEKLAMATQAARGGVSEIRQTQIFEQCANVVRWLSKKHPLLLILDDLHWADMASINLLFHLGRRTAGSRILILGTYRSEEILQGRGGERHPLDGVLNEIKRLYGDVFIELDADSRTEGRDFIDAFLDQEPNRLENNFRQELFRRTSGHALFTVEFLNDLKARGNLVKDEADHWVLGASLDWSSLPVQLVGVVAERISRLDDDQRQILEAACVEGEKFTAEVIAAMLEVPQSEMVKVLSQDLEKRHLLIRERGDRQGSSGRVSRFEFTHNLFQHYLYNQLGNGRRRLLHGKVAKGLETVYQDQVEEIAVQLANHFDIAGSAEKAYCYLQLAGERALRHYAYREAIDHLSRALESNCEKETLQQAKLHSQLGQAYRGIGDFPKCRNHLSQALALIDRPMPDTPAKLLFGLLRQLTRQALQRLLPNIFISRRTSEEKREILLETARIYSILGYIFYFANESLPTIYSTLRMLNLAERCGPSPELARAYANMCVSAGLVPLHRLAEAYGKQAFKVARSVDQLPNLVNASIVISAYKSGVGQWGVVREILDEALVICERIGDYRQWSECLGMLACCAIMEGDFARGIELGELILESARDQSNTLHQAWGMEWLSLSHLRMGENAKASHLLEEALTLLADNAERTAEIENYGMLALARLRINQPLEARQAADMASERIAQAGLPSMYSMIIGYDGMTEVYLQLWEERLSEIPQMPSGQARLEQLAHQACKNMHAYKRAFPIGLPSAWLHQGRYDWLSGKQRVAHKAWRKSLAAAHRLAMPYDGGLAHYEIGRHLPTGDPNREEHLSQAVETFSRLGANFDLERAEAEMQKA